MKAEELFNSHFTQESRERFELLLELMLGAIGLDWEERYRIKESVFTILLGHHMRHDEAAQSIWRIFEPLALDVRLALEDRAAQISSQVEAWAIEPLLDWGCGDGRIAKNLYDLGMSKIVLCDTSDERCMEVRDANLPFISDFEDLAGRKFGSVLLLNVLHNVGGNDLIKRVAGRANRIIIIDADDECIEHNQANAMANWLFNCLASAQNMESWCYETQLTMMRPMQLKNLGFKPVHDEKLGLDLHIDPVPHRLLVFDRA